MYEQSQIIPEHQGLEGLLKAVRQTLLRPAVQRLSIELKASQVVVQWVQDLHEGEPDEPVQIPDLDPREVLNRAYVSLIPWREAGLRGITSALAHGARGGSCVGLIGHLACLTRLSQRYSIAGAAEALEEDPPSFLGHRVWQDAKMEEEKVIVCFGRWRTVVDLPSTLKAYIVEVPTT